MALAGAQEQSVSRADISQIVYKYANDADQKKTLLLKDFNPTSMIHAGGRQVMYGATNQRLGVPAIYPTTPSGLAVTFPNTGTPDSSDSTCMLSNTQGWPNLLLFTHNDVITHNNATLSALNAPGAAGADYARYNVIAYNILTSGWNNGGAGAVGAGTPLETFNWDATTLFAFSEVFVGRAASKYTEYGNNPECVDPSGCTGSGCNSPVESIYFPSSANCTGPTPTSNCVGVRRHR